MIAIGVVTLVILIALIIIFVFGSKPANSTGKGTEDSETETQLSPEELLALQRAEMLANADALAVTYDYDGAIALIQGWEGYAEDEELTNKLAGYEAQKAACVRVDISQVTHIFYHSLVVDPERCFNPNDFQGRGNYEWMTTISEFNKITQEMYDRGYVLVSIHDLYKYVTDENGNQVMVENDIYLPEGKKAFVLSLDDLSYYHSYDNYGYAAKLIIDENGDVINEYIDADGNVHYGLYDCVPLLDQFIEEHPDASYKGAICQLYVLPETQQSAAGAVYEMDPRRLLAYVSGDSYFGGVFADRLCAGTAEKKEKVPCKGTFILYNAWTFLFLPAPAPAKAPLRTSAEHRFATSLAAPENPKWQPGLRNWVRFDLPALQCKRRQFRFPWCKQCGYCLPAAFHRDCP